MAFTADIMAMWLPSGAFGGLHETARFGLGGSRCHVAHRARAAALCLLHGIACRRVRWERTSDIRGVSSERNFRLVFRTALRCPSLQSVRAGSVGSHGLVGFECRLGDTFGCSLGQAQKRGAFVVRSVCSFRGATLGERGLLRRRAAASLDGLVGGAK